MKKINKSRAAKISVLLFAFVLSLSLFFTDYTSAKQAALTTADSYAVSYEDVTGKVDMSSIAAENFNSKVRTAESTNNQTKTVIVSLSGSSLLQRVAPEGYDSVADYSESVSGKLAIEDINRTQNRFLSRLKSKGISYEVKYSYNTLDNAVAIKVPASRIAEIRNISGVKSVVASNTYLTPQWTESSSSAVHNDTFVYKTGIYDSSAILDRYSGQGMVVAVLDTGLDYTHNAFRKLPDDLNNLGMTEADVSDALANADLTAVKKSASMGNKLTLKDLYLSAKVPFAYDYADNDADVYPSYSSHGTHVAGIVAGNDDSYTNKDGELVEEPFIGVAPNAQLVIGKVFTDNLDAEGLGGAETENILAALEDCVKLNVDVINMSLGSSAGFTTTDDGDDDGEYLDRVYTSVRNAGISLVCAASNDYSAGYGGAFGTNLASNPDAGTVGAPSTYAAALSVASISGQQSKYMLGNKGVNNYETAVFYDEANDAHSNPYDFAEMLLKGNETDTFEYVVVPGVGKVSDYSNTIRRLFREKDRIALVSRGENSFQEKVEIAMEMGAVGVLIYNNVAGKIRMTIGEIEEPIPAASITLDAGTALKEGARNDDTPSNSVGTITIDKTLLAGPFMSDFSSWGCTPDLKLKPEITAHGGEITSAVAGGYDEYSGTSMASPNMAGAIALIREYICEKFELTDSVADRIKATELTNQVVMSNATIAYDTEGLAYSPRKQGAGLANLVNSISTSVYMSVEGSDKTKLEFGDDKNKVGEYSFSFKMHNFGASSVSFKAESLFMTETLAIGGLAVAEKAHMLTDIAPEWKVNGTVSNGQITLAANSVCDISVTLKLSDAEKKYIDDSFKNGMFVEGFLRFVSETEGQNDVSIPFLAFYGDWTDAPLLDYSSFELAEFEKDTSIKDEEKPNASVWATQPYTSYQDQYILPMGTYIYSLPDDADPMYAEEEHCAVSCYNTYLGENNNANYRTSYNIRALYVGLLRNARTVDYSMYNTLTGELVEEKTINRVGKAYSAGGGGRPGFIDMELSPEEYGLPNNTQYTMNFKFAMDYPGGENVARNEYSFSFYTDYDAPILTGSRVRYYYYTEGNKTKHRIYLDLDVYDNHYAQSVILCYVEDNELKLITDYVTPVRNAVKNGNNTVSIEITDIYEKYGSELYVQLDDYAMNYKVYALDLASSVRNSMPTSIKAADNEKNLTLDINEMRKVTPIMDSNIDLSELRWESSNNNVVRVKAGEIVGVKKGTATVTVSTAKGGTVKASYRITVTDNVRKLSYPAISFGLIKNSSESQVKATGIVDVHPNSYISLEIEKDPWYYSDALDIVWRSTNEKVATVDNNGNVHTLMKGTTSILATINGTSYSTSVTLRVGEEFIVRNYALVDYHGLGGVVEIPSDKNIMYIGEEAFEDNDNITEIIIPKSVTEIREKAFINCSALERVSFIQSTPMEIADADLTLINNRAFYNCRKLKEIDFSNVKTISIGKEAFAECVSLNNIIAMTKIGTIYDDGFKNCKSLTKIDLTRLNRAGANVFSGCTMLSQVDTAEFTSIGENMFYGCNGLRNIVINTAKIGAGAFRQCGNLESVTFNVNGTDIPKETFEECYSLENVTFNGTINTIGDSAFAYTYLTTFTVPEGLTDIGSNVFTGLTLDKVILNDNIDISAAFTSNSPFYGITVKAYEVSDTSTLYSAENGVVYDKNKTRLLLVPSDKTTGFAIPASVTEIAANAFNGNRSVKTIDGDILTFSDGYSTSVANVNKIGAYAFAGSNIESVTLGENVMSLGEGAFYGSAISSFELPHNTKIRKISANTFNGASRLGRVSIPDIVTEYGDYAFAGTSLTEIDINVEVLGDNVYSGCVRLTRAVVNGAKIIGEKTFFNCVNLVSVSLPAVEQLGDYTFNEASSLQSVSFAEGALSIGNYTFYSETERTRLTNVTLPSTVKSTGDYTFYNCVNLTNLNTSEIENIGSHAFYNCQSIKTLDMGNVLTVGELAFGNNNGTGDLTAINLPKATDIGRMAFYGNPATVINIPSAINIDKLAFFATQAASINIPASVENIGEGAFSGINTLTAFTSGNQKYFSDDGILYRNVGEGKYELFAYPGGRKAFEESAEQQYYTLFIKEGTVRIAAYAVSGLKSGVVSEVVIPYSVATIGDFAFYQSGISYYSFERVNAPVLESNYNALVYNLLYNQTRNNYRGLFYSNFENFFAYPYLGSKLGITIVYPENGVGYDNMIYSTYFSNKMTMPEIMDDYTRETKNMIEGLTSSAEVKGWMDLSVTDDNKAMIEKFSATVKEARLHLNNVTSAVQLGFIGDENVEKLSAVETELRNVKNKFSIPVVVESMRLANNNYKKDYTEGESFDMTGLEINLIYDDGSVAKADLSQLALKEEYNSLSRYDRTVELTGYGTSIRVAVNVTAKSEDSSSSSDSSSNSSTESSSSFGNSSSSSENNGNCVGGLIGGTVGLVAVICVALFVILRKKKTVN